jgi:molybdopterin converting factor small subunit
MSIQIRIPTPLRSFTGEQHDVNIEASTVGEALSALSIRFPAIKPHLYTDAGALRSYVNIYLNDSDVRFLKKDKTLVSEGDTILIIPSIAGGTPSEVLQNS